MLWSCLLPAVAVTRLVLATRDRGPIPTGDDAVTAGATGGSTDRTAPDADRAGAVPAG